MSRIHFVILFWLGMHLPLSAQTLCCVDNGGLHPSGQQCQDGSPLPPQCQKDIERPSRAYVWRSPSTGSIQMSGTMPAWYRTPDNKGPRTWVYENGALMDDGKPLAPSLALRLRRDAENYETQDVLQTEIESIRALREQWETEHLRDGKIDLGMSEELVTRIMGEPISIDQQVNTDGTAIETWNYENGSWVEFKTDLVSSFRQRAITSQGDLGQQDVTESGEVRVIATPDTQ